MSHESARPPIRGLPRSTDLLSQIQEGRRPRTVSDTEWIDVGDTADPLAPSFGTGITAAGGNWAAPGFYLSEDGEVRCHGHVDPGTVVTPAVLFTFPAGYRPFESEEFVVPMSDTGVAFIRVDPDGVCTLVRMEP